MQIWQTIESAPKDGRAILLKDGVAMAVCWWGQERLKRAGLWEQLCQHLDNEKAREQKRT